MSRDGRPVALFVPSLEGGGAERVAVRLANGLASRGLSVDLVLARREGPFLDEVGEGVGVVDLRARRIRASLVGLTRYLRRRQPIGLVSFQTHANVVALVARDLALADTAVVATEHVPSHHRRRRGSGATSRWMLALMRRTYPRARAVVAVSDGVAADIAEQLGTGRAAVVTVPNPVVPDDLAVRSREPLAHPWFEPGQPPVLLGAGRLDPQKDFATLIAAFEHVRDRVAARLVILGEGPERPALEARLAASRARRDVDLAGFVTNPYPYFREASAFVLSSRWEGLPTALIEAMACGTRVVSTDCPSGPAEILDEGRYGRLVPVGGVEALGEAMLAALGEPEPPDVAGRAARYGVDRAVDAYLALLTTRA